MKNISAWAIRHPTLPLVLFVVLLFLGVSAFIRLPINLNPDIAYPLVMVSVSQPGAAPAKSRPGDAEGRRRGGERRQRARDHLARDRGAEPHVRRVQIGTPIDRAVNDVRDAVAKVQRAARGHRAGRAARGCRRGRDRVLRGQHHRHDAAGTVWFVDNTITKRLLAVPGIAQVTRGGGVDREIRVELDPARMQALGITAVGSTSSCGNQHRRTGRSRPVGGGEQAIRVLGGAKSAFDLGETRIAVPGGRVVQLKDIAEVRDSVAESALAGALQQPRCDDLRHLQVEGQLRRHGISRSSMPSSTRCARSIRGSPSRWCSRPWITRSTPTIRRSMRCSRDRCSRCWSCSCSCATAAPRSRRSRSRCRRSRPSHSCNGWVSR